MVIACVSESGPTPDGNNPTAEPGAVCRVSERARGATWRLLGIAMVLAAGPFNEMRSIVTGWYRTDRDVEAGSKR